MGAELPRSEMSVIPGRFRHRLPVLIAAGIVLGIGGAPNASGAPTQVWERWLHIPGVLDVAGPRSDGRLVLAVGGRLELMDPSGALVRFAPAYSVPSGPESYIVMPPGITVASAGCDFPRDTVYALDLRSKPLGIDAIDPTGAVSVIARIPSAGSLNGIAFDLEGSFGHRLLVVEKGDTTSRVFAVDCAGGVDTIARLDATIEGGMVVAPPTFGAFGGQLIAADEVHGLIFAISSTGKVSVVASPRIPKGQDVGVESLGFVPPAGGGVAYVADRGTPKSGNPHPGTDTLLRLHAGALSAAGVVGGDLLAAAEGGGVLVDVRCAATCESAVVATGPSMGHIEGHVFVGAAAMPPSSPAARQPKKSSSGEPLVWIIVAVGVVAVAVTALVARSRPARHKDR